MEDSFEYTDDAFKEINRAKCYFDFFDKGDAFIADFESQIQFLIRMPEAFQIRYRNIRIINLEHFDYAIHYENFTNKIIVVRFLSKNQEY